MDKIKENLMRQVMADSGEDFSDCFGKCIGCGGCVTKRSLSIRGASKQKLYIGKFS